MIFLKNKPVMLSWITLGIVLAVYDPAYSQLHAGLCSQAMLVKDSSQLSIKIPERLGFEEIIQEQENLLNQISNSLQVDPFQIPELAVAEILRPKISQLLEEEAALIAQHGTVQSMQEFRSSLKNAEILGAKATSWIEKINKVLKGGLFSRPLFVSRQKQLDYLTEEFRKCHFDLKKCSTEMNAEIDKIKDGYRRSKSIAQKIQDQIEILNGVSERERSLEIKSEIQVYVRQLSSSLVPLEGLISNLRSSVGSAKIFLDETVPSVKTMAKSAIYQGAPKHLLDELQVSEVAGSNIEQELKNMVALQKKGTISNKELLNLLEEKLRTVNNLTPEEFLYIFSIIPRGVGWGRKDSGTVTGIVNNYRRRSYDDLNFERSSMKIFLLNLVKVRVPSHQKGILLQHLDFFYGFTKRECSDLSESFEQDLRATILELASR